MSDETKPEPSRGGRRGGGREARRTMRAGGVTDASSFLTRTMKPFELVSDEGLELLEYNADTILEQVGVEIRDYPSAIERFRAAYTFGETPVKPLPIIYDRVTAA